MQAYLRIFNRVKCNSVYSGWPSLRCRVSQGSLLGTLLFNIFVNDVNYIVDFVNYVNYILHSPLLSALITPPNTQMNRTLHCLSVPII